MELTVAVEHRFMATPDRAVWTATGLGRASWTRYLGCFDRVRVMARVQQVSARDPAWIRVDGDRVEVAPVPYYVGPSEYLRHAVAVGRSIRAILDGSRGAVILRVPGNLGSIAARSLTRARRPFGVEVVADPHDTFAPGSVDHPLRPLLRWWSTRDLRQLCASSTCALYVTSAALQGRYPPPTEGASFSASDVELGDECFVERPRPIDAPAGPPFRIITVGTLAQLYKRPQLLIRSVASVVARGVDATLVIVGDGQFRSMLEKLARELGIAARVRFAGNLPSGHAVRTELDDAHLFVLTSRQEGMPRAMIEAMARGLPCLGTRVGGIPELLDESALISPDPDAIAVRIREIALSSEVRAGMSSRNLDRARKFHERALRPTRDAFFAQLVRATNAWSRRRPLTASDNQKKLALPR
jgi:glycosyltransferase involved in cell wall biosynthesis